MGGVSTASGGSAFNIPAILALTPEEQGQIRNILSLYVVVGIIEDISTNAL